MSLPILALERITFYFNTEQQTLFKDLTLSFTSGRYGLVGDNGCGKTSLLRLLSGELKPNNGRRMLCGQLAYQAQINTGMEQQTVAEVLAVADKLAALKRITAGSIAQSDYDLVGDDWDLQIKIDQCFAQLNLTGLPLPARLEELSGGERTRLFLVKAILSDADFLLLDEPSNNLDKISREALYQFIVSWPKALIIASHDRQLLSFMDHIIELNALGVHHYGGNYQHYLQQCQQIRAAKLQQAHAQEQRLLKKQQQINKRLVQHQQAANKGQQEKKQQIKALGSYDKLALKAQKGRSERTASRISKQASRQLADVEQQLQTAKAQLLIDESLHFDLKHTALPNNKTVVECEQLSFAYDKQKAIFNGLSFRVTGPERMAIMGKNGSGKTTLIKLLLQQLCPQAGSLQLKLNNYAYIDQHCSTLVDELSILENYQQRHPKQSITDAYHRLAQFKFRNKAALNIVGTLSGGERLRALLACELMATPPPQLLILDEPTNHLDVTSIEYLEQILQAYQGCLIVVSHDEVFLDNIGVTRRLHLDHIGA